jgi:hypothetical protein
MEGNGFSGYEIKLTNTLTTSDISNIESKKAMQPKNN